MSYKIFDNGIIHELLENEVIIANLNTGVYYSIRGSGCILWQLLLSGHSVKEAEELFSSQYKTEACIAPFVQKLIEERILVKSSDTPVQISLNWPKTFEAPTFERYEEMKNLLLLDPIHEVDEHGWPSAAK